MQPSPVPPDASPREALADSLTQATPDDPETFRDEANADKQVEIPQDKTDRPIRGLDPAEGTGR